MINRISKKIILILLFSMLFVLLFPKTINAVLIEKHRDNGKGLYEYGPRAVGNTIRIWRSGAHLYVSDDEKQNRFIQDRESSHIYCIQHLKPTVRVDFYDYPITNYIKIRGNVATNSKGQSHTSSQNFVFANLLHQKSDNPALNFKRGYGGNGDEEIRNLAVKHYMTTSGWVSNVGKKLGINDSYVTYYNLNNDPDLSDKRKQKVINLINTVTRDFEDTTPSISANKSIITADSEMKKFGPITFKFTGKLESIKLYNGNTEVTGTKTYEIKRNNQTITTSKISDIKSGDSVTIKKTDTKEVTKIQATSSGNVLEAEIWFCVRSNTKQNLIVVNTNEYPETQNVNITVNKTPSPASTVLTIEKRDADTGKLINDVAKFKIKTSSGWLSGTQGSYKYDNSSEANAREYSTTNGVLTLVGLANGKYTAKEEKAPQGYIKSTSTISRTISDKVRQPSAMIFYNTPEQVETEDFGLTIHKKDEETGRFITSDEAVFMIKTDEGYLSGEEGNYKYDNATKTAAGSKGRYPTTKGKISLIGLKEGTYTAEEVEAPSRYIKTSITQSRTINESTPNASAMVFYNTPTGSLTVLKKDSKTDEALSGSRFKIYKEKSGWLTGVNTYTRDKGKAKIYSTNTNGELTINGLYYGTYTVEEVTPPAGYILAVQPIGSIEVTISSSDRDPVEDYENVRKGSITIHKIDTESKQNIEGAGFKIETSPGKWLSGTRAPYNYSASYEKATTYRFKNEYSSIDNVIYSRGNSLKIDGLNDGTYHLYEVEPPTGYLLKHQEGYDANKKYVDIKQEVTISSGDDNYDVDITVMNIKKVSIEGYVWEDTQATKDGAFNSLYDSSRESRIQGVTVKLMKKGDTTPVGTTKTDKKGKYLFDSLIKLSALEKYYVEFDYNDAMGKKYIPVAFNATDENGSKAIMDSVATKDVDLSGVATTYKGTSAIDTYGFMKCGTFDEKNLTIGNINLGIKKIPNTDYTVDENLEYVKIVMKNYTYTYKYGSSGNSSSVAAPKVNFQDKGNISGYTADIYPSDIAYEIKNQKEDLKVYVGYRIDITNTTITGTGDKENNYNELYAEKTLNISSVVNEFDKKRYTLSDSNWEEKEGFATMKPEYMNDIKNTGILSEKTATKRIQFKVKREAILEILNHPYGIIEDYPTKVSITGYHKYERYDFGWSYNIRTKNKQTHITEDEDQDASAPYLIFKLGQERILKGKVFEDNKDNERYKKSGEKLGNGLYDNNENVVKGVRVELLDASPTETDITQLTVSNLYEAQGSGDKARTAISKPAETTTDEYGNYTLNGVVPGYYYLRFTYGDGNQKIYDVNKKELKNVVSKNYKSTIVTNDVAKNALQGKEGDEWYKKITSEIYSVAVDNLTTRKNVNEGKTQIAMAGTAKVSITIENDKTGISSDVNQMDNGNVQEVKNLNTQVATTYSGLSFGIIDVPEQDSEIKKLITNVKLTNAQGNVLYNGNPETVVSQGVVAISDLDSTINGGSTYVRAEMTEESLYGTNLEITYEVTITNKSDLNYYNNEYYWFGEYKLDSNGNRIKEVTLTPKDVKDYLDEILTYLAEKSDKDRIKSNNVKTIAVEDGKTVKAEELDLTGWKPLFTNKLTNRDANHPTSDKVKIVAQRLFSSQDDDMEVVSRAEIKDIIRTPDPNDKITLQTEKEEQVKIAPKEVNKNEMVKVTFTVTPPTGEDRSTTTIYVIAGIVALIVLSTGIVIIKKKV